MLLQHTKQNVYWNFDCDQRKSKYRQSFKWSVKAWERHVWQHKRIRSSFMWQEEMGRHPKMMYGREHYHLQTAPYSKILFRISVIPHISRRNPYTFHIVACFPYISIWTLRSGVPQNKFDRRQFLKRSLYLCTHSFTIPSKAKALYRGVGYTTQKEQRKRPCNII